MSQTYIPSSKRHPGLVDRFSAEADPVRRPAQRQPEHGGQHTEPSRRAGDYAQPGFEIDFRWLAQQFKRYRLMIAVAGVLGALLAVSAGILIPAKYTSIAEILIDPSNLQVVNDDLFGRNEQRDAQVLNVESKMRLLTSTNVLSRVVETLDLTSSPDFMPRPSLLSGLFDGGQNATAGSPELAALRQLAQSVKARRDQLSFVVTLEVTAASPERSVQISSAIIDAFRVELAQADADNAGQAAGELTNRLDELKAQVTQAEEAVERFRTENGLQASQGELLASLSASQINAQLIEARQRLIEARSRYEELSGSNGEALVAAAAQASPVLVTLRTQYAALEQESNALLQTLGPRHPKYAVLVPQMRSLESQIDLETARVLQAAQSELLQAEGVVSRLTEESVEAQSALAQDNSAQVQLRELERTADAQAAIYEAFLSRSSEIAERQRIDTTNIRVISEPLPPKSRSWPPSLLNLLVLGLVGGLALGALAALSLIAWRVISSKAPKAVTA